MAEIDKREAILARLEELFNSVSGVKKAFRNTLDIAEKDRPAVVILDADESGDEEAEGRGRPVSVAPILVTMTPEIFILAGATADEIGPSLNALRISLIKAVLGDNSLVAMTKDGDIRYLGFSTGLAAGRSMEGEAGISFQFRYMIRPTNL